MHLGNLDSTPSSETFGQDASFRLEQPIGSMSISPSGRDVVLASKEGLHIVDLDSPYSPPRYLPHRTPWEVADVQWSPFAARDYWIVSTSNQKALVWNVGTHSDRDAIEFVLHAHSRAITDINFSAHHPELLATCAVDSFVHGWDLRSPSRPSFSFSNWFAGATQVKFSRQDEHLMASSHDRVLHIWDKRKGAYPLKSIEAHGTKIYGIDWNRFEGSKIVTCSLDKTIKFWDVSKDSETPDRVIETGFPVWRARHTPFGWGLLAMPQRDISDLHLYDRRGIDGTRPTGHVRPVTTFPGHKGQVKEFLWRIQGSVGEVDDRDFQLVTWGTDRELRLHHVAEETFHAVGFEKGITKGQRLNFTRRGARYRTFRDVIPESYSPSEFTSRTDSFPSQTQYLGFRNRQSTNIGMSKVPVAQFRGWLQGNRKERRTGMHGRAATRQDMNPITWMKNVKIASWDPDSLADEITQVGEKFQKVEFDAIDIGQRKAVMSVQGPWGENNATIYTRVDLRFPKAYPRGANAIVTIQKSNSIDMDMHRTLSTEVRTIAETYASRQRGCIEAVVRYLLSEQSMEQIVSWLLTETSADSRILEPVELPDDLSSDSDDENLGDAANAANTAANDRVPLPKACSAFWANDGRLICFFPKENKEPSSVLARRNVNMLEDPPSKKLFEAFGRLRTDSPAHKARAGIIDMNDTSSETSDEDSVVSGSSTSSFSSSSQGEDGIRDQFTPYKNGISLGLARRAPSEDHSNRSATMDGTKGGIDVTLNVVSIHDDTVELMPAKRFLAEKYQIIGDGMSICEHNTCIAHEAQLPDIASIWRLAGLILEKRVPLEAMEPVGHDTDAILLMARKSASVSQQNVDTSGLNSAKRAPATHSIIKGGVRWGNHPFANAYLVTAMFNYFEKKADIQMLAMLSCVFAQAETTMISDGSQNDMPSAALPSKGQHYFPAVDITLSVASPLSATSQAAIRNQANCLPNGDIARPFLAPNTVSFHKRRQTVHSKVPVEYRDVATNQPATAVESPMAGAKPFTKAVSASTSPNELRFNRDSIATSAFAASRASLSALAQSYSRSPPSNNSTAASSLKKPSPSTAVSTTTWAANFFSREAGSRAGGRQTPDIYEASTDDHSRSTYRTSISSVSIQESRRDSNKTYHTSRGSIRSSAAVQQDGNTRTKPRRKRVVRTKLHNQAQFDLDGYADQPLVDLHSIKRHHMYRTAYAELLNVWGLWAKRAEILQVDSISEAGISEGSAKTSGSRRARQPKNGLEVNRCCPECGNTLVPIYKRGVLAGWHCTTNRCLFSVNQISHSQICSICERVVHGLSVPCLQCGHITCYECAQLWFGNSATSRPLSINTTDSMHQNDQAPVSDDANSRPKRTCPTGCGCVCSDLNHINVPWPPDEGSNNAVTSITPISALRRQSTTSSTPSGKPKVEPGLDTALGAMMALSSRSRAPSTAAPGGKPGMAPNSYHEDQFLGDDELMPWASSRFTTLGRGIGGGLSRGLSNRSSDATIRKI